MAPSFKLFSRPSFRSYTSSESTPSVQTPQSRFFGRDNGTPPSLPNEKAEKVLGGPEFEKQPGSAKKRQSSRERRSLRKFPSFMSMTSADASAESPAQEQEFPFAGMRYSNDFSADGPQTLQRQGSSPLLGYQANIVSTCTSDYFSPGLKFVTRRTETSASFKSSQSVPRSPLRMHHPMTSPSMPNLSPLRSNPHFSPQLPRNEGTFHRPPSSGRNGGSRNRGASLTSEKNSTSGPKLDTGDPGHDIFHQPKPSDGSAKSKLSVPRRRPSVNDPPTLYPETPRLSHAVSPPPALITSSLPTAVKSLNPNPKPIIRPRWWTRNKAQDPPIDTAVHHDVPSATGLDFNVKINSKKPNAGTNNWFDSFDEDDVDSTLKEDVEPNLVDSAPPDEHDQVESQEHRDSSSRQWTENPTLLSKKSSLSSKTTQSDRRPNLRFEFPTSEAVLHHDPIALANKPPALKTRESQTSSLRSGGSSLGVSIRLDLQIHSVLSLSSSDEEDDFDEPARKAESSSFLFDSSQTIVESNVYPDEVMRSPQTGQPARLRHPANKVPRRQSSRRSRTPEKLPPVPQIPSRHPVSQRSSSLRCSDILEEKASSSTDMGADSIFDSGSNGETPITTPTSSCPSVTHKKKLTSRHSKLMKVTSDEEKLLEAMRHKRASMHINEFQKGFNEALALQEDPASSQNQRSTSLMITGTTGSKRSSMLHSNRSISPAPMLTSARYDGIISSRAALDVPSNPKRISTDSYNYEEEQSPGLPGEQTRFPFPPQLPPPNSKLPAPPVRHQSVQPGEVLVPRQSPTLSCTTSDVMSPSTPSTTNMPLTPPPMTMSLPPGLLEGGLYRTMSENGRKADPKLGHDRKRTVSSVVVLDGMEMAAREADEERDLIGWAMDTY